MKPENIATKTEVAEAKKNQTPNSAAVDKAIRNSVYAAMGIGVFPIPFVNAAAVTTANVLLASKISKLYGVEFKEGAAKNIIVSVIGAGAGVLASPVLATAVIGIPLVGFPLAVGSQAMMYGMTTYAIGRMFATQFERGGNFVNANLDAMKADFTAAFKNSREWVGDSISGRKSTEAKVV